MYSGDLIRSGNNAKTIKGDDVYETAIMYLAPHKLSELGNTCSMAVMAGCIAGCLNTSGRGAFNNVQLARINKTKRYFSDRQKFMDDLSIDIARFVAYCERKGVKPAIRLNGTSDIQFETAHPVLGYSKQGNKYVVGKLYKSIFEAYPQVQFYDYTKIYKRVYKDLPSNYSLVLSYSEANQKYADKIIQAAKETGANVAAVYRTKEMRDDEATKSESNIWVTGSNVLYRTVIDGDKTDMRFLDPQGVIVGLYAKGKAKKDQSGFVLG